MSQKRPYHISFSGLAQEKYQFQFVVDNAFFYDFDYTEFIDAEAIVEVSLVKQNTILKLSLSATGSVTVNCDLTNQTYNQPISGKLDFLVKFGTQFNNENEDILIIPYNQNQIDLSQYIYEMIVLAVPQKRIHPKVTDGSLNSDLLNEFRLLQPKEKPKLKNKQTDPRWNALKELLT